jgi:hypothetical protein
MNENEKVKRLIGLAETYLEFEGLQAYLLDAYLLDVWYLLSIALQQRIHRLLLILLHLRTLVLGIG